MCDPKSSHGKGIYFNSLVFNDYCDKLRQLMRHIATWFIE